MNALTMTKDIDGYTITIKATTEVGPSGKTEWTWIAETEEPLYVHHWPVMKIYRCRRSKTRVAALLIKSLFDAIIEGFISEDHSGICFPLNGFKLADGKYKADGSYDLKKGEYFYYLNGRNLPIRSKYVNQREKEAQQVLPGGNQQGTDWVPDEFGEVERENN